MSRCRCDDIREQESLINTLERAWSGFDEANGNINAVRERTECIEKLYQKTSIQVKMQNCVNYFPSLCGDLGSVRSRIDGEISSTLSRLHNELEEMREEDDDHHEEEEEARLAALEAEQAKKSGAGR